MGQHAGVPEQAAFAPVPTLQLPMPHCGQATANPSLVHGPADGRRYFNWKEFPDYGIRQTCRVRGDAFNAFNHVNYGNW